MCHVLRITSRIRDVTRLSETLHFLLINEKGNSFVQRDKTALIHTFFCLQKRRSNAPAIMKLEHTKFASHSFPFDRRRSNADETGSGTPAFTLGGAHSRCPCASCMCQCVRVHVHVCSHLHKRRIDPLYVYMPTHTVTLAAGALLQYGNNSIDENLKL